MYSIKKILFFTFMILSAGCYNGDKTLIPKQPFVPLEVEEGFSLIFEPKVDILFIIDDSGSMSTAQTKLAQNINLFTTAMEKNKFLDYHIGAITTSNGPDYASKSGYLQGKPTFVTRAMATGLRDLENNITRIGTMGDYKEKFFDPLVASIDPAKNLNPGFFRSDSFFVLILITDTKDQSDDNSGFKAHNMLVNLKASDVDKVLGYGVMSYPPFFGDNCGQDDREPENLFEFMSLFSNALNTQIGGGVSTIPKSTSVPVPPKFFKLTNVFSLCDANFGQKLANIGDDIRLRVSQKIPLPVRPVDGTIKLKYGTQVIDKKWWKYDFGTNSIILDPLVELDDNQPDDAQLFVVMDQSDPLNTIGNPQ
jgi:hypothetical protein